LKESRKPATPKTRGGSAHEFGVVTIDFNPGPDSRDRLRRLYTLLLEHATAERQPDRVESRPEHEPDVDGAAAK